jgi:hypothetical protein
MSGVSLSGVGSTGETQQQNPRLVSAAHEFEASLMKEFLKPLQHDSLFAEGDKKDDDEPTGSAETLMSYGAEAMAKSLSEHGGFGIAQEILDHFQKSTHPSQADTNSGAVRF